MILLMFSAKIDEWFDVLDQGQAEADVWLRQGGYSPVRGYMRIMGGGIQSTLHPRNSHITLINAA